jgi:hypothetical protein
MIDLFLSRWRVGVVRLLGIAFCCSFASCAALVNGIHGTTVTFPVEKPIAGATTYSGWTEISFQEDISSVTSATLMSVTLSPKLPANTPDLSFLESVVGSVVPATGAAVEVVDQNGFPRGEPTVILRNDYLGNLKDLRKDAHTIHITWTGTLNPAYKNWPETGFEVQADIEIDVQE